VHFNHYGRDAVELAVALVNDRPAGPADLATRCVEAGFVLVGAPTDDDHRRLGRFLDLWYLVAATADENGRAAQMNSILDRYAGPPRMTNHLGTGWHLHFRDDDVPVWRQVATLLGVGTAMHLTGRGIDRLGVCVADTCPRVYADTSRNGRQRYCSPACANRAAVRRHRARQS
jgi:hypothetical protein